MLFSELHEKIEKFSPERYALAKDNTGFQIGRSDKEINNICLATDATDDVIEQAIMGEADLIITHHPIIFNPLMKITDDDIIGRRIIKLINHDINFMSMHTNFDVIGMAVYSADMLGLIDPKVLNVTFDDGIKKQGIGRYGRLPRKMSIKKCAELVKEAFDLSSVSVYSQHDKSIKTVAVSPGSSSDVLSHALKAGVDLLITGEIKHSMALEAMDNGLVLIDAGHYGTEKIFVPCLEDYFYRELPEVNVFTAIEVNPFYVV